MYLGLFLVGSGIGMFTPPNNSNVMGNVPKIHCHVCCTPCNTLLSGTSSSNSGRNSHTNSQIWK